MKYNHRLVGVICSVLFVISTSVVLADVYMHNPRGSNDRNCERNENRNNGNRLFDSQNNDKGGYACPRPVSNIPLPVDQTMYYYEGSNLRIEWTNQHGCGPQDDTYCQIIFQYMCEDQNPAIRDGTPETMDDAATDRMDAGDVGNTRFGYHETYPYYQRCATRDRNNGLYTADQNLGDQATSTRQDPNANRQGWECSEERDYYPYWHPAPWKDIAILSSDFGNYLPSCNWYQKNSQNNVKVGHCFTKDSMAVLAPTDKKTPKPGPMSMDDPNVTPLRYNQQSSCESKGGYWYTAPSLGGGNPECQNLNPVRPNSLGNDPTGQMASYTWVIPQVNTANAEDKQAGLQCVLRMRYNVSSNEIPFDLDFKSNNNRDADKYIGPNQDPYTQPFEAFTAPAGTNIPNSDKMGYYNLSLALNTNQYGRTFQDRSYVFYIRSRGSHYGGAPSGTIHNLNVRGKRGNIVQTFPAVEYDFVPQTLNVNQGEHIHIQWTGSDYNPDRQPNNAEGGPQDLANQGTYRADRSNMIQLTDNDPKQNIPADADMKQKGPTFFGKNQARLFAFLGQDLVKDCQDYKTLLANNNNNQDEADKDSHNCYKLNAKATPYFNGGVIQANQMGTFHFVSSRNNNFSNRSQKSTIIVGRNGLSPGAAAGVSIAAITGAAGAAAVGGYFYSKKNPGSQVAQFYNKVMTHRFGIN